MIKKDSWVQIEKVILNPEDRSPNLPKATQRVPLKMWIKGYLLEDAELGASVHIKTLTGRKESGVLLCQNPSYMHTYGAFVPEILGIDKMVKAILFEGDSNE